MMKILVVEASHDLRARVVNTLCEVDGVVVQGAVAELGAALRALEACPLDGVVAGAKLPEGDVLGLILAARRRRVSSIIVYDAGDTAAAHAPYLAAGASSVMSAMQGPGAVVESRLPELAATLGQLAQLHATSPVDSLPLLGRLAAGIAHDINNYLAAADVALTFAERGTDPDVCLELRDVRASFDGVVRLARSLTTYARGALPCVEQVDLVALVHRTLEGFKRVIPDTVRVIVETASDVPLVRGISAELEQLALNLIVNACDAMPAGGRLWLTVERAGPGQVRFEVRDTARGIPAEVLQSSGATSPSFSPSFSPSRRAGCTGAGLGLGIVRAVAARHAAQLTIEPAPDEGTRVELLLPAA